MGKGPPENIVYIKLFDPLESVKKCGRRTGRRLKHSRDPTTRSKYTLVPDLNLLKFVEVGRRH